MQFQKQLNVKVEIEGNEMLRLSASGYDKKVEFLLRQSIL